MITIATATLTVTALIASMTVGGVVEGGGFTLVTFWFRLRYATGTKERLCGVAGISGTLLLYAISGGCRSAAFALAATGVGASHATNRFRELLNQTPHTIPKALN